MISGEYTNTHAGYRRHRRALEQLLGRSIEKGMSVLHICDSMACINPSHLYEGTQKDNIADAKQRGRMNLSGLTLGHLPEIREKAAKKMVGHPYWKGRFKPGEVWTWKSINGRRVWTRLN